MWNRRPRSYEYQEVERRHRRRVFIWWLVGTVVSASILIGELAYFIMKG